MNDLNTCIHTVSRCKLPGHCIDLQLFVTNLAHRNLQKNKINQPLSVINNRTTGTEYKN